MSPFCLLPLMWIPHPHPASSSLLGLHCLALSPKVGLSALKPNGPTPRFCARSLQFFPKGIARQTLAVPFSWSHFWCPGRECFRAFRGTLPSPASRPSVWVTFFLSSRLLAHGEQDSSSFVIPLCPDLLSAFVEWMSELWLLLRVRSSLRLQILSPCLHIFHLTWWQPVAQATALSSGSYTSTPFVVGALSLFLPPSLCHPQPWNNLSQAVAQLPPLRLLAWLKRSLLWGLSWHLSDVLSCSCPMPCSFSLEPDPRGEVLTIHLL